METNNSNRNINKKRCNDICEQPRKRSNDSHHLGDFIDFNDFINNFSKEIRDSCMENGISKTDTQIYIEARNAYYRMIINDSVFSSEIYDCNRNEN